MSELELHQPSSQHSADLDLVGQMDYARAVASAAMLPDAYRGKPADIMLAVGLGQSMGLSPAESLYRINVIKGKPAASAELIAANVRKAGHRLRITGDETTATAVIIRADDPDFEFSATRDLAWAERMELTKNPNYKKQLGTMLRWRAITAVAREACPEALYGVSYTPDELGDLPQARAAQTQPANSSDALRAALRPSAAPQTSPASTSASPQSPQQGEQVGAGEPHSTSNQDDLVEDEAAARAEVTRAEVMLDPKSKLGRHLFAAMGNAGITQKEDRLALCSDVTGRTITSSSQLTEAEAHAVIREVVGDDMPTEEPS